ncbi:MAG: flagellar basal body P-ring protein FlgI [Phycisphaerae bacterium]|nr:flagellar basal body P-ring protein FlgI [Phycisphaerae bacterium]
MKRIPDFLYFLLLLSAMFFGGCAQPQQQIEPNAPNPRDTIGSISRYISTETTPVRSIGIVAGLAGTGSSECPPAVRQELEKYIQQQVQVGTVNPRAVINSLDTAVVEISGVIPALSMTGDTFDLALKPLSSTQTTSLDGGYLYTADLKEQSRLTNVEQYTLFTKTLATAEGPVYSCKANEVSQRKWFVLGGGRVKQDSSVKLILNTPDFITANAVRNRINERLGPKTAVALSTAEISLAIPAQYLDQRQIFLKLVESLILTENPAIQNEYAQTLIQKIISKSGDIEDAEIALEGIGRPALDVIAPLLEHPDPVVRFFAAKCMLNIGDSRGLFVLRSVSADEQSPYRIEAIRVIGRSAKRRDALPILTNALNDSRIQVRLEAYEMLVYLNSPVISRRTVADGAFIIDNVVCSGPQMVYVFRQDFPKIVLFGSPIYCSKNLFIQSRDQSLTINSVPGAKYISVSRKHPNRPRVLGPLLCNYELSSLIRTLGELSDVKQSAAAQPGLAVPYSEIIDILEIMSTQNAIPAQFFAGPEPIIEPVLQELPSN